MQNNKKRFFFTPGLEKLPPHIAVKVDSKSTNEAFKRWQFWVALVLAAMLPMTVADFLNIDSLFGIAVIPGVLIVIAWKYIAGSIAKTEIEKLRKEAAMDGKRLEEIPPPLDDTLKAHDEINKFQLKGALIFLFVCIPISSVLWMGILYPVNKWLLSTAEQGVFTFVTEMSALPLLACFPGAATGYFLYYFYVKKYHPVVADHEKESGSKALKYVGMIIVVLLYAIPFLLMDFHTVFKDDEISHNGVLSFSTVRYSYDRITEIRYLKGKGDRKPLLFIEFADGETWSSQNVWDIGDSEEKKLAEFVSQKSGKKIREVEDINEARSGD